MFINGKIKNRVHMAPDSRKLMSIHPAPYLYIFSPFNYLLETFNICHWLSVHISYGGQFLRIMFSQNITEGPKHLIRKKEKRRHKTEQKPIVVLYLFLIPTQSLPLWLDYPPTILIYVILRSPLKP